jgi:hypothetical protein
MSDATPNDDDENGAPKTHLTALDFAVPAGVFVFAGIVAYLTTTFDKASPLVIGDAMQPRDFPLFLMVVISLLNVVVIIQTIKNPPRARPLEPWQTWASMALLGVFFVLAAYADMFLGLIVAMFLMVIVWGERRLWVAALVAILTPAIIFFTFDQALEVRFPRGVLTNLWYGD